MFLGLASVEFEFGHLLSPACKFCFSILIHFDFKINANHYQSDKGWIIMNQSEYAFASLSIQNTYALGWYRSPHFACMFLFCLLPWPYLLNIQTFSSEWLDVFSIAAQVFSILLLKICPLFGQILITCLKCSRASFSLASYSDKMHWGRGWVDRDNTGFPSMTSNYWYLHIQSLIVGIWTIKSHVRNLMFYFMQTLDVHWTSR